MLQHATEAYQVYTPPRCRRTNYRRLIQDVGAFCATTSTSTSEPRNKETAKSSFKHQEGDPNIPFQPQRSIPSVPSSLFQQLAESQLELLANSIRCEDSGQCKIRSAAIYLPAENAITGQLEFTPAILFPNPKNERVFIANDSDSGLPPSLPQTLTILPGFSHASVLIPRYPMVSISESEPGVGLVEEVHCDGTNTALSVPLFAGSQTVGVLLVSPSSDDSWSTKDRQQVAKAAQSISLALSMETERAVLAEQHQSIQYALSESLHQVKNPLQALRTYGKLLQQRMADPSSAASSNTKLLELTEHLILQSDRLVDRLKPVDELVASLSVPLALKPAEEKALVPWRPPLSVETANEPDDVGNFLGEMELEMSFVPDVLQSVFASFGGIAEAAGIRFQVVESDDLPGVTIWVEALQEAVINLLDNAVKYNDKESPEILVRLLAHTDGVTILIEDNGPGIPPKEAAAVFQRGYRGSGSVTKGSGIGLTIARALVEQMGGTLRLVPSSDKSSYPRSLGGTTMELKLFRRRRNQATAP